MKTYFVQISKLQFAGTIVIALLLGFFGMSAFHIGIPENYQHIWAQYTFSDFTWADILIVFAFAVVAEALMLFLGYKTGAISAVFSCEKNRKWKVPVVGICAAILLLLAWFPYLLTFAPGFVLGDSFDSIEAGLASVIPRDNHHPVLYSFIVGCFMRLGRMLGSYQLGVLLYTITQYILFASCLGYVIAFLYKKHLRYPFLIGALCFFALFPVFPNMSLTMWKDPLFSCALLLLGILLFDMASVKKPSVLQLVWLVFLSLCAAFLRNNGVFILILIIILIVIFYRTYALSVKICLAAVIAAALLIQGPVYSKLNIASHSVEALGIPLQQIAYCAKYDELSPDEIATLNKYLPYEDWKTFYTPCLVDTIKWHSRFNTDYMESADGTKELLTLWVNMLPGHFDSYCKAYLLETLGFWHPYLQHEYGYINQYISSNDMGIHTTDLVKQASGISLQDALKSFRPQIGTGTLVWILLLALGVSFAAKKRKTAWLLIPGLAAWLIVMISTPVAFSLRYLFVLLLMLPLMAFLPFLEKNKLSNIA